MLSGRLPHPHMCRTLHSRTPANRHCSDVDPGCRLRSGALVSLDGNAEVQGAAGGGVHRC